MPARTPPRILACLLLAAGAAPAQEIVHGGSIASARIGPSLPASELVHVPGDHATVQEAIDAAAPGTRIVVRGGDHPAIVVDRPLTIVGDPPPVFHIDESGSGLAEAPIRLVGPGSGRVVLANLIVGGTVGGPYFSASESGIEGGGFDELLVHDCDVRAPDWVPYEGVGLGEPGIDVTVPWLLVSRSTVRASDTESDDIALFGLPPGAPGVRTTGNAIVLDATLRGGETDDVFGFSCAVGGEGGPGIVAGTLYRAGSTILGGTGALHYAGYPSNITPCGQALDGPPTLVTKEIQLPPGLAASAPPRRGRPWSLSWDPGVPARLLITRERLLAPLSVPFLGWTFLDPTAAASWYQGLPGPGSRAFRLPDSEDVVGLTVTVQLLELGSGFSRPVSACVLP